MQLQAAQFGVGEVPTIRVYVQKNLESDLPLVALKLKPGDMFEQTVGGD